MDHLLTCKVVVSRSGQLILIPNSHPEGVVQFWHRGACWKHWDHHGRKYTYGETIDSSEEQDLPMELGDESCHSVR